MRNQWGVGFVVLMVGLLVWVVCLTEACLNRQRAYAERGRVDESAKRRYFSDRAKRRTERRLEQEAWEKQQKDGLMRFLKETEPKE